MTIFIGFVISVSLTVICVAVANAKGRNPWVWGILGFLFGFITLIVIAARPGVGPSTHDVEPSMSSGVRNCPQCDAENDWGSGYCSNCGASLGLAPDVEGRVATQARFLTPLVGLIVGLVFALILLQATKLSTETVVGEMPSVVLFWPVSSELQSVTSRQPVTDLVWDRFPATLQIMVMGGGLAVLLAWGLAPGYADDTQVLQQEG